ncbi:Amidohydrolase family protein [Rhodovastum atsumiense]|uniref:Amidohydrolase family protein n=1 Tax=Rhodovastum atsumiense TaxID=504468 RepID=A0A5M6ILR7_9PROT|nr:amidohydrolase family protein [Rhodovastum atsumiense]KAA5608799.1 amidohydrolase family protein [Rhodovastum atsumiense]CAH2600867.1 Amidohydrolase family protein [Rhodovastum atsumiense]
MPQALTSHITDTHVALGESGDPAALAQYRAGMAAAGIGRCVVVQPECCGTDNAATLAAVAAVGPAARGVVILPEDITPRELDLLAAQGICGARCCLGGAITWEHLLRLAPRLNDRGWHVELVFDASEWPACEERVRAIPGWVVLFADFGEEPDAAAAAALLRTLEAGNAWVKLGAHVPQALARRLARQVPDRCLWASNWPVCQAPLPDLLAVVETWTDDRATRSQILETNPAALYGFS